ncbi:MAG: J domain-containing protein [Candidatus Magasanikbacteria bacterium]
MRERSQNTSDYYLGILGLSPGSNKDVIKKRYHELLIENNPANFVGAKEQALASERMEEILKARDYFFPRPIQEKRNYAPPPPPDSYPPDAPRDESSQGKKSEFKVKETVAEVEKDFIQAVRGGIETFAKWRARSTPFGIDSKRISDLFNTNEEVQINFAEQLRSQMDKGGFRNPKIAVDFLKVWGDLGMEIENLLRDKRVILEIRLKALDAIRQASLGSPADFIYFVNTWKDNIGINLRGVINTNEAMRILIGKILLKIQSPEGKQGNTLSFRTMADDWKNIDFDLSGLLSESKDIQKTLGQLAQEKYNTPNKELFVRFVSNWKSVGWQPDNLLENRFEEEYQKLYKHSY